MSYTEFQGEVVKRQELIQVHTTRSKSLRLDPSKPREMLAALEGQTITGGYPRVELTVHLEDGRDVVVTGEEAPRGSHVRFFATGFAKDENQLLRPLGIDGFVVVATTSAGLAKPRLCRGFPGPAFGEAVGEAAAKAPTEVLTLSVTGPQPDAEPLPAPKPAEPLPRPGLQVVGAQERATNKDITGWRL